MDQINPLYYLRLPVLGVIKLYQYTFSPDHGWLKFLFPNGCCRFTPTCSQYGFEAVKHHGVFKGLALACWRILRCNPWSNGGLDLVPPKRKN